MARTPDEPRRLPKRIAELTLPAPYDDFHVTCWMNAPRSVWLETLSEDEGAVAAALSQIVVGHDLVDFDGNPYPPANEPGGLFWEQIPSEVGIVIMKALVQATGKLPPPTAAP